MNVDFLKFRLFLASSNLHIFYKLVGSNALHCVCVEAGEVQPAPGAVEGGAGGSGPTHQEFRP